MPNNITDNEIKKALECCYDLESLAICHQCPLYQTEYCRDGYLGLQAFKLINRQDFRINQLNKEILEIQNANLIDWNATIGNYKAENETLKAEVERLKTENKLLSRYEDYIKAKAYKECLEKVKTKARLVCTGHGEAGFVVDVFDIDNLLNELVGDNNV